MAVSSQAQPQDQKPLSVRAEGLSKRYGNVRALEDVSFSLRVGEVMALLGENGAGKSTFVKVLAGLVQPDEGALYLDEEEVTLRGSVQSQNAGIAVVQQEISAVKNLTVAENLVLGQVDAPRFWTRRGLAGRARIALDRVGLADIDPGALMGSLGVAEMQLVEIARVLSRDARVIVFDEPTAALADAEIERVLAIVRWLAEQGRSIVYVTHRLNEVLRIADRVTIFRNGKSFSPENTQGLGVRDIVRKMIGHEPGSTFTSKSEPGEVLLDVEQLTAPGLVTPVSLKVRAGEIVGLTGQLGSGAGTSVRALAGVVPGSAGTVRLGGDDVSLANRAAGLKMGVAYCSGDRKKDGIFAQLPTLKSLSSPWLRSAARFGALSRDLEIQKARSIAEKFSFDLGRLSADAGKLSGGNQQKVALGKWLGAGPKVLLAEEPTRGVDVGARAEVYAALRSLCDEGLAVVIASSDTQEVLGLCDRIGAFYRGRLVKLKDRDEWTEADLAQELMHQGAQETVGAGVAADSDQGGDPNLEDTR